MIQKIDKYIIKSFIGPFIITFFIALFILLIQFLWKYIDDLVGKGLEWYIIAKLLFYASANLIPLALPLATLLSSIMLYGNMGERFELVALKSAGISMFRFMRSTIMIGVIITIGAFLFSNYVLPSASLKFWTTLLDITRQKPALNIKPKEFYSEIEGYTILLGDKAEDNVHVKDVTIYEEKKGQQTDNVLIAEHGEMKPSTDELNLVMKMFNGKQYEQLKAQQKGSKTKEFMRMEFGEWEKTLDLSGFQMQETGEEMYRNHYKMMNIRQLRTSIDSISRQTYDRMKPLKKTLAPYYFFSRDTNLVFSQEGKVQYTTSFAETLPVKDKKVILTNASTTAKSLQGHSRNIADTMKASETKIIEHKIEVHRKITLSLACLVFLFVGAPLGAIIRKGGFGLPVIFSILIFIFFYVLNISGERMADQSAITVFNGMWLAIMIIFPFSIYLTIKAKNDAPVVSTEWYANTFRKLKEGIKKSFA